MALDYYVGSFTRYYTRDWENVVQVAAREQGMEYHQVGPGGGDDEPMPPEELREIVLSMQSSLSEALGDNIDAPLRWDESEESPYFTDRPGWAGYGAVLLLAAYADHADATLPDEMPEDFFSDPVFAAARDDEFKSRFPTLLRCDLWLPGDFAFSFNGPDLTGESRRFGSVGELVKDLTRLGDEVLAATPSDAARWSQPSLRTKRRCWILQGTVGRYGTDWRRKRR